MYGSFVRQRHLTDGRVVRKADVSLEPKLTLTMVSKCPVSDTMQTSNYEIVPMPEIRYTTIFMCPLSQSMRCPSRTNRARRNHDSCIDIPKIIGRYLRFVVAIL